MKDVHWGIIGCGDVTEVKSGPAFNKVEHSSLVAVMRRDTEKARDYAFRHNVPQWYDNACNLINDPKVNAVYIATPPSSHEEYAIACIKAGKPVYIEKPMTLNYDSALRIAKAAEDNSVKVVVAHYRRAQPLFIKVRQLLQEKVIGNVNLVDLRFYKKPLTTEELSVPKTAWRVDPAIAGGGLFHDLAPHQLDLMLFFFGRSKKATGVTASHSSIYTAPDIIAGTILFENDVVFNGSWCFNVYESEETDICEILGSKGKISFSIFGGQKITVTCNGETNVFNFDPIQHVQQPMIKKVVDYFLGEASNPCSAHEGALVMQIMDSLTKNG